MSQVETQDNLQGAEGGGDEGDNLKFVPVAESIRYRKRAQGAEKKVEELSSQLSDAKTEAAKMSEQLKSVQMEQELLRKLAAAGAMDLEAAVVIAKSRCDDSSGMDLDSVIEQLKNISQIEHSRHRSVTSFLVNLICGLIAYARQPKKPSLGRETLAFLSA